MNLTIPVLLTIAFTLYPVPGLFAQVPADEIAALKARETALSESLKATPSSVQTLSNRGDIRQFMGQFADAVSDFERMIALDPTQDAPHWRLGIAYYFAGSYQKAARQFEKYHAFDGRDRENGVWKFMSQAKGEGLEAARKEMLSYERFDREPFPALYDMFAGKITPEEVIKHITSNHLEEQKQVVFFAKYYVGVYLTLTGQTAKGLAYINESVALFTPATAGQGGPGYMWQVARLHAGILKSESVPQPDAKTPQ
ncbi:MAG: hypothetical protein WCO60_01075 [Verrucomicrobiota bacterium]